MKNFDHHSSGLFLCVFTVSMVMAQAKPAASPQPNPRPAKNPSKSGPSMTLPDLVHVF